MTTLRDTLNRNARKTRAANRCYCAGNYGHTSREGPASEAPVADLPWTIEHAGHRGRSALLRC